VVNGFGAAPNVDFSDRRESAGFSGDTRLARDKPDSPAVKLCRKARMGKTPTFGWTNGQGNGAIGQLNAAAPSSSLQGRSTTKRVAFQLHADA
jgi:hypothetical protein